MLIAQMLIECGCLFLFGSCLQCTLLFLSETTRQLLKKLPAVGCVAVAISPVDAAVVARLERCGHHGAVSVLMPPAMCTRLFVEYLTTCILGFPGSPRIFEPCCPETSLGSPRIFEPCCPETSLGSPGIFELLYQVVPKPLWVLQGFLNHVVPKPLWALQGFLNHVVPKTSLGSPGIFEPCCPETSLGSPGIFEPRCGTFTVHDFQRCAWQIMFAGQLQWEESLPSPASRPGFCHDIWFLDASS